MDFPRRVEWKIGDVLQIYDTVFFTGGTKMICAVGLPEFTSVPSGTTIRIAITVERRKTH